MNASPIVNAFDQVLFVNAFTAASNLFDYSDADGDEAVLYRFTDGLSASFSGVFELNGTPQGNGTRFTIDAADLANLIYVAGSNISNEEITIEAYDGFHWSAPVTLRAYSAVENVTRPIASTSDTSVLGNESIAATSFISAFDPDGHPIEKFYLRDRRVDNAYFSFDGQMVPQTEYITVQAEDMDKLRFHGNFRGTDLVDVFAWDGVSWSVRSTSAVETVFNANRPVAQFKRTLVPSERPTAVATIDQFCGCGRQHGQRLTAFTIRIHTLTREPSVSEVLNNRIASGFGSMPINLETLSILVPSDHTSRRVRYQVYDGRYWSPIETLEFQNSSVPVLGGPDNALDSHLKAFNISPLFEQIDDGLDAITYEVIDTNPAIASGKLELFNTRLAEGQVIELTAEEFEQLNFRTGPYEDRSYDEVYVRATNGIFFGDWERAILRGEPEYDQALFSGTDWNQYSPTYTADGRLIITYSYMQQFPNYETGEAEDSPGNDPPRPFTVFTTEQRNATRRAFRHFESFANVAFVEVADTAIDPVGGDRGGTIRMGNYRVEFDASTAAAFAFLPAPSPEAGDIWINTFYMGVDDWSDGTAEYTTFLHELGHATGMLHPFTLPGSGDVKPVLPEATDSDLYTVMSYTGSDAGSPRTFQLYDISELQRLYGANNSFALGDDVYGIDTFFAGDQDGFGTIWDAGGIDEITAIGSTIENPVIDLRSGGISSIGMNDENLVIAFEVEIENATGSANNDTITGNEANNRIVGLAGDDVFRGMGGDDYVSGGAGSDTYHWGIADGNDTIDEAAGAGRDTLVVDEFPGLDSLTQDLSFRLNNRDLVIDLRLDDGAVFSRLTIENQLFGRYRVESLQVGGETYDLVNLASQATSEEQKFQASGGSSTFGLLVSPIA